VICSHIRKYCDFLQQWIIWTCIVSYKAVERGCVVRVTYLHNYLLDYSLTYSIEQSPLEKPTGSQLFFPPFFLKYLTNAEYMISSWPVRLLPLFRQFLLIAITINKPTDLRENCSTPCFNQFCQRGFTPKKLCCCIRSLFNNILVF